MNKRRFPKLATVFAALLAISCLAAAQLPQATATLTMDKKSVAAAGTLTGHVTVTFPEGYHAYQNPPTDEFEIPVKLEIAKGSRFKLLKVKYPKGTPLPVAGETKPSEVYTDTISIPITLKAPAKAGAISLLLTLSYQQCNENSCLPPASIDLVAKLTVKPPLKKASKSS
jgi:DsbC/DsbD-like thiol-disulfide interchange protein